MSACQASVKIPPPYRKQKILVYRAQRPNFVYTNGEKATIMRQILVYRPARGRSVYTRRD